MFILRPASAIVLAFVIAMACGVPSGETRGAGNQAELPTTINASSRIVGNDCVLDEGHYSAVPALPTESQHALPLFQLELLGQTVEGTISWDGSSTRPWQALRNVVYRPGTAWCVQFEALLGQSQSEGIWVTAYLHVWSAHDEGYRAVVTWDHLDSRADEYVLTRTRA